MLINDILTEVNMSPRALEQWAKSPDAEGARAGFEAEVIFSDILDGGGDREPDFDADERMYNASDIMGFFEDENGRRAVQQVIDELEDAYMDASSEAATEWVDDQMDEVIDREFDDYWSDNSEDLINSRMESRGWDPDGPREEDDETEDDWQTARDEAESDALEDAKSEFREENEDRIRDELYDDYHNNHGLDFDDFLDDHIGGAYASDVYHSYSHTLNWPYWNEEEAGFSDDEAANIASRMQEVVGMNVVASGSYHAAKRSDNRWIIEPDSSLEPDAPEDMPAEIVSPPMPLHTCLDKMQTLFQWLLDNNAYTNESTGCHVGVSVPFSGGDRVDFVKLVLFTGDDVVLSDFSRTANHYCKSALAKVKERFRGKKMTDADMQNVMKLMRNNLMELAKNYMPKDFGKYTSINIKRDAAYVEFRSPGGEDYLKDFTKMRNTVLRFVRALSIANDPAAERNEYAKKLYKLITNNVQQDPSADPMAYLSRYMAGSQTPDMLKAFLQQMQTRRDTIRSASTEESPSGWWGIYDKDDGWRLASQRGRLAAERMQAQFPHPEQTALHPMYWWRIVNANDGAQSAVILAADMDEAISTMVKKGYDKAKYSIVMAPREEQARISQEQG